MCKHIRFQVHCCSHCSDTSTRSGISSMQQLNRQVSMHVMRLLDCVAPAVKTGETICWLSSVDLVEVDLR